MKISQKELSELIAEAIEETLGLDYSNRGRQKPIGKFGAPVVEEEDENNPWSICTASVGRDDKEKYERCVQDLKKEIGYKG